MALNSVYKQHNMSYAMESSSVFYSSPAGTACFSLSDVKRLNYVSRITEANNTAPEFMLSHAFM